MITSLAIMLQAFIKKEKELVKKYGIINHPGMIGQMYEGLTKEALQQTLPKNIDLKIVSGKIITSDGNLSDQLDCMLVEGNGDRIPHTDNFIYKSNQVLAVIEVKKNLFTDSLESSFKNLNTFHEVVWPEEMNEQQRKLVTIAFHMIFYQTKIYENFSNQTLTERWTYINITRDAGNPLKIVWAYEGIKSEKGLRKTIYKVLQKNDLKAGFEPFNFPDLIICNDCALLKLNGMPFGFPFTSLGTWPFIGSCGDNPLDLLLHLIWIRIYHKYNLSRNTFGEGLKTFSINPLFSLEFIETDTVKGWVYYETGDNFEIEDPNNWKPKFIDEIEFNFLMRLYNEGEIDLDDKKLRKILRKHKILIEAFVQKLLTNDWIELHKTKVSLKDKEHLILGTCPQGFYAVNKFDSNFINWAKQFGSRTLIDPRTFSRLFPDQ